MARRIQSSHKMLNRRKTHSMGTKPASSSSVSSIFTHTSAHEMIDFGLFNIGSQWSHISSCYRLEMRKDKNRRTQ